MTAMKAKHHDFTWWCERCEHYDDEKEECIVSSTCHYDEYDKEAERPDEFMAREY